MEMIAELSMVKFLVLTTSLGAVLLAILAVLLFRGTPQQLWVRRFVFVCLTVFWVLKAAVRHHFWIH